MDASTAVRGALSWPALAAWGAGLIQIALGAGALMGTQGGVVLRTAGIVLIGLGVAGFAWGGTALARGRLIVPRAGVVGVVLGLAALVAALTADPARISVIAVAAASALLIVAGVGCAIVRRACLDGDWQAVPEATGKGNSRRSPQNAARGRIAGILVSAVAVAAIVTPALAATEAGQLAPDHVSHMEVEKHQH